MAGINETTGALIPNSKNTGADTPNQPTQTDVAKPTSEKLDTKGNKDVAGKVKEYVEGVAEVIPNCDYTNGVIFKMNGLGKIFSGNYYVQKATHTISDSYNVGLEVSMVEGKVLDQSRTNTREELVRQDPPKSPEAPNQQVITIKRGDTLWDLSRKYGTTVEELVRINDIKNPDLIYTGNPIKVPNK